VVGQYTGKGYRSSNSRPLPVTVVAASTTTSLTLSPATVTYGHEQAERLSVQITPAHGGTPTGTVTVKKNASTVCVIKLSAAKGSCTLAAQALQPGSPALIAVYSGDHSYQGSASAAEKLIVAK